MLQYGSIFISVLAVWVFYQACRSVGTSARTATALALLFGLAAAFFAYSSQIEVYNVASFFMCVAALGMALPTDRTGRRLLVGGGYFLAMGFHQAAIFLGAAILIDELGRSRGRARWVGLGRSLVLPLVAIGASYVLSGAVLGHRSPAALWQWITLYSHLPFWGLGRPDAATLRELAVGVARTLIDVTNLSKWVLVGACLGLATFIAVYWPSQLRLGERRRFVLALLGWLLAYRVCS